MQAIDNQEWQSLPEQAQQEIYDFFLFIKQRYERRARQTQHDETETLLFSNHSANSIEEWLDDSEEDVWK